MSDHVNNATLLAQVTGGKPARFAHDCGGCVYLGQCFDDSYGGPAEHDLYVCARNGTIDTVIARRSSEPGDYASGVIFAIRGFRPSLVEALRRAKVLGYRLHPRDVENYGDRVEE